MIIRTLLLVAFLFVAGATASFADSSMMRGYERFDDQGVPYSTKYYRVTPSGNVVALVRRSGLTEDQFVLRITAPHSKSGCADISNIGYSAEYRDVYLDIALAPITIDFRDQPQYSHYECDRGSKTPKADIVLNKSDLAVNQTEKIRMHNGPDTTYYVLTYTDDMVKILPETASMMAKSHFKPYQMPHKKTSLVYWFYPLGTVIMWVPGMDKNKKTDATLRDFAHRKGLVPLEDIMPNFESPLADNSFQYFVDTSGTFVQNDDDLQYGKVIGSIPVEKSVFGLEKDEIVISNMDVYARLPGEYD